MIPPFTHFQVGGLAIEAAQHLELQATVMARTRDADARVSKPIVTVCGKVPPETLAHYSQASNMIIDLLNVSAPVVLAGPGRHGCLAVTCLVSSEATADSDPGSTS